MRASMFRGKPNQSYSLLTAFALVLLGVNVMQAQDELSRENAVERSLQNNLGIRLAQQKAEMAAIGNAWGAAGALPQVGISASGSNSVSDQSQNPTSFIQEKLESESVNLGGQLNWMLFDGLGMFANKRSLERLEEQADGQVDLIIEQAVAATMIAYNGVMLQRAVVEVLATSMEISLARLVWIDARTANGAATTFDRLQFENALLSDSLAWRQQRANVRQAVIALNRLMGELPEREWEFTSPLVVPESIRDFDQLSEAALSNAKTIENALISKELASVGLQQAQARMSPTLSLNASQSDQSSRFSAGDLSGEGKTINLAASFTINFNLFNGGATRRAIQQAKIQLAMAETQADEERREVHRWLSDAWIRWVASQETYSIALQLTSNSNRMLEIAEERLANGSINSLDFREIQIQALNAAQQQIQALNAWQAADIELHRLTGAWSYRLQVE